MEAMSSPSSTAHDSGPLEGWLDPDRLLRPVEAVGFWAAVVLPFVYVPVILTGLDTPSEQLAVAVLIAVHVLALIVGRRYHSE